MEGPSTLVFPTSPTYTSDTSRYPGAKDSSSVSVESASNGWWGHIWRAVLEHPWNFNELWQTLPQCSDLFVKAGPLVMTAARRWWAPWKPWLYLCYTRCGTRDLHQTDHTFGFNWYWLRCRQVWKYVQKCHLWRCGSHWNSTKKKG